MIRVHVRADLVVRPLLRRATSAQYLTRDLLRMRLDQVAAAMAEDHGVRGRERDELRLVGSVRAGLAASRLLPECHGRVGRLAVTVSAVESKSARPDPWQKQARTCSLGSLDSASSVNLREGIRS